jgi:hypothetical protein
MLSLHTYIHLCNCEPKRFYDSFVVFYKWKKCLQSFTMFI